ncbi:MAG: (E)-4-hydroxy-3-methylbut-2-enyl-diphosphate synthase [Bacteroidia bacterium]|nr:(E)-4-hydroxy-3-methylbut-2-enyl-diphosphate synthase [Bacteroidia bacterium]MBP7245771.1 (E)-4-hydroxy-3-methylbut-2-enyl-diphosphate synthase [Bacteroidia bacterium]
MTLESLSGLYCNSLTRYDRLLTREVMLGDIGIGGNNPIRVQSMTTTDTMDTLATVEQSIRMIEAGCEFVRITAPSINEAKNLANIKQELAKRGYKTPLIADIHFTPNAAEAAARIVEKVRINPGNFADKKKFAFIDYNDAAYNEELDRIRERFIPLLKICKEYGTAMRIGTNHGSLSDRIMSRYGDTAHGMVESALEFLRIAEAENYHNIVLSMKSSNPQVMVQAYRTLIVRMHNEGMNYPLHLGVTEAGEGEDGRIKSAAGIGTLLEDGIGDTVRVSLTEDPEFEIPIAKALVERYTKRAAHTALPDFPLLQMDAERIVLNSNVEFGFKPFEYERRSTNEVNNFGAHQVPRVIADYSKVEKLSAASFFPVGYNYSVPTDKWNLSDQACDYIYTGNRNIDFEIPGTLGIIVDATAWKEKDRCYPLFSLDGFLAAENKSKQLNFVSVQTDGIAELGKHNQVLKDSNVVLLLSTTNEHAMPALRQAFILLMQMKMDVPVVIHRTYDGLTEEQFQLYASTDLGALLLDGFGDGVMISSTTSISPQKINSLAFGILQAARTRISKTEYISCPSCGRTLFDLQETTAKIRTRTDHLKGLKIGIMGCIVNGPGEMADADYGYVGSGPGKITLYKGREVVQKSINTELAVDALIDLIKEHGDWIEK